MSQTPAETEIISKAMNGDRQAFRWIVEHHQRFVYAVGYKILGNRVEAEDIAQETFVRLWKNLSKYRSDVKLTTWLYKIATNLCLDHLRSSRHKILLRTVAPDEAVTSQESSDQQVMATEFSEAVRIFAASLQPRQRAVFVLREVEGLSVKEVSDILSMSSDLIKSNLYHARMQITKWMKEHYSEKKGTQT
jgi:RNA polymerase sigma-70 factor, ECF subfamily